MSGLIFPAYMLLVFGCLWAFGKRTAGPTQGTSGLGPLVAGILFVGVGLAVGTGPATTLYVVATVLLIGVGCFVILACLVAALINVLPAPWWHRG